ncbi:hypothetical protein V8D89_006444 [Ganoderma adspersum]
MCANLTKVYNETLHWVWPASSFLGGSPGNVSIRFSGTAVYVYNILTNLPANFAFTLDGSPVAPYDKSGEGEGIYEYFYRQLVYANDNLSHGDHDLVIGGESLIIFDYIKYTSESSNGSSLTVLSLPSSSTTLPPPSPPDPPRTMFTITTSLLHTITTRVPVLDTPVPSAADTPTTGTTTGTTATTATALSKEGSNLSTVAIAGGVVGIILGLLLLAIITLFVRRRLSSRRSGKRMGRLLDEDLPPHMDDANHPMSNGGQFLRPTYPAHRLTPDVPRSPGYTTSSIPTSPTSYGGEPPSRTYLNDGTVARILEKVDRAHHEWPSSTGTKSLHAVFGTVERWTSNVISLQIHIDSTVARPPILLFLFLLAVFRFTTATPTNRTIDDQTGDSVSGLLPQYSPSNAWHQGSTCTTCRIHLDPSQTFKGTWHDSTGSSEEPRIITMRFNGTAVYVYNALANTVASTDTTTNITFTLDDLDHHYAHKPTNGTAFDYKIPVYTKENLANKEHILVIQANSLVLFDYAVYTFDDTLTSTATSTSSRKKQPLSTSQAASSAPSSPPTAAIVGGVVGGIVALLALVGAFVFICMRRRRRRQSVHIKVIEEKPRRSRVLPRLSILASELGPPSAATNEGGGHYSRSSMGTPGADVESQGRSPLHLPPLVSANSPRAFHEGQGSAWSHTVSTALESPRGAYLFGGKSDVDIPAEGVDRPPGISLPPASPVDPRPRARRSPNMETAALRSEVAALRKEVERLREKRKTKTVANASNDDDNPDPPPPRYDGPGDSGH